MAYDKILGNGTVVRVPYWHDYCERHRQMFPLRHGCSLCRQEREKVKELSKSNDEG